MKTEGCIHDGWLVLRDSEGELDQDFLYYLLGSRFMYEKFSKLAAGSTVQNLNSALVSSVEIPVPPMSLQRKIAEKARVLEQNVARLNEVTEIRLRHVEELRQSILEAAFRGEL
jgi:type I restriction enzyme S subunit